MLVHSRIFFYSTCLECSVLQAWRASGFVGRMYACMLADINLPCTPGESYSIHNFQDSYCSKAYCYSTHTREELNFFDDPRHMCLQTRPAQINMTAQPTFWDETENLTSSVEMYTQSDALSSTQQESSIACEHCYDLAT